MTNDRTENTSSQKEDHYDQTCNHFNGAWKQLFR